VKSKSTKKCILQTSLNESCPKNCKNIIQDILPPQSSDEKCIAKEKMNAFLEGETSFSVGISAFYQASNHTIERFISQRKENLELVSYYLSISDPEKVSSIVEELSEETTFQIFYESYTNYLKLRDNYREGNRIKNFFHLKGNLYWQHVDFKKICNLMRYIVSEKKEYSLAAQFLILLPTAVVIRLQDYISLKDDEIRNLYLGLGDSLYELPVKNPGVYPYMIQILKDEADIFPVLSSMEELVKRQEKILLITDKLIRYYETHSFGLTIQHIYSELNGLETELVSEILTQLQQREVLSDSQKDMLNMIFQKGSVDFLRSIREDILN